MAKYNTDEKLKYLAFKTEKKFLQRIRYFLTPPELTCFVAGVQRSGINMIMDVLERSLETDVYHERDSRAFEDYQMRESNIIKTLRRKSKSKVFVIKSLCELHDLDNLLDELAPSKVVWVYRHYGSVINSMLVSFKNQAKQVRALAEDPSMGGWWLGKGISEKTLNIVRKFAEPDLDDANAAALQYYLRNVLFFERGFENNKRVFLVNYENILLNPSAEFEKIFGFLSLKFKMEYVSNINASSVKRISMPQLKPEIESLADGLYKRFHAYHSAGTTGE